MKKLKQSIGVLMVITMLLSAGISVFAQGVQNELNLEKQLESDQTSNNFDNPIKQQSEETEETEESEEAEKSEGAEKSEESEETEEFEEAEETEGTAELKERDEPQEPQEHRVNKPKIIEVVVPAIWYPIDSDGNIREGINVIETVPNMIIPGKIVLPEVATLNSETGKYDISFIGKYPIPGGYINARQPTTQIFVVDKFHRIVAQGNWESTYPIKKAIYGTNTYIVKNMVDELEFQEGETLHLYIDSLVASISSAEFVEEDLLVEYETDEQVLDEIYGNIRSIETYNLYDFPNKLTWGNDESENPYRLAKNMLFLYKYDGAGGGEFIKEGQEYKNFYDGSFAELEPGKYEIVLPTHWKALGKFYYGMSLKGEETFSRLRFTQDDTVHFTMSFQFPKIDISVTKEWAGPKAEEVTLVLLADGVETDVTLVLNSENKWEGIFQGLDKYNTNKEEISYTIAEVRLDNYNSSITGTVEDGFTVTNTYMPQISPKVEVTGTKVWVGGPKDKPTIELQLYRNNKAFGNPVSLASGELEYTWTELDKTDADGNDYVYSIKEVEVPKNYKSKISEDGLTITNTYIEPPKVGVAETYKPKTSEDKLTVTKTDIEPSIVPEQIQTLPRTGSKNNLITLVFAIVLTSVGVSMVFRKMKVYDE